MSSPPKPELKAGHPPAVKAGGMRVVSKRAPADTGVAAEAAAEIPPDDTQMATTPGSDDGGPLIISGVAVKGNADFTKEAIQSFHDKPQPAMEKRPPGTKGAAARHPIQQPGKRQ